MSAVTPPCLYKANSSKNLAIYSVLKMRICTTRYIMFLTICAMCMSFRWTQEEKDVSTDSQSTESSQANPFLYKYKEYLAGDNPSLWVTNDSILYFFFKDGTYQCDVIKWEKHPSIRVYEYLYKWNIVNSKTLTLTFDSSPKYDVQEFSIKILSADSMALYYKNITPKTKERIDIQKSYYVKNRMDTTLLSMGCAISAKKYKGPKPRIKLDCTLRGWPNKKREQEFELKNKLLNRQFAP
jgi:hypothetical protein